MDAHDIRHPGRMERYLRLERAFLARPEQRVREAAIGVDYAREVLRWNRQDLEAALARVGGSRKLDIAASARIHNFLASVYSMLSAFKRTLPARERGRISDSDEFDRRLSAVFGSDVGCFILVLRHYCQHYRHPTEFSLNWSAGQKPGGPAHRLSLKPEPVLVYLDTNRVLDKGSAANAARYVSEAGLTVDLWEAVEALTQLLEQFDSWFTAWYRRSYQSEIETLNSAELEVAYALLAWRLESWSLERDGYPGHLIEPLLTHAIGLNRVDVMLGSPEGAVIAELNLARPIDADLECLIRESFRTWADETGWAAERRRRGADDGQSVEQAHQADAQERIVD